MKNFDLYKGIIFGALLLLPVVGWWWWTIEEQIDVGEAAIRREQTDNGFLVKIGQAQQRWQTVLRNERKNANLDDKGSFFEQKVLTSARGGGIRRDDFTIGPEQPVNVPGVRSARDINVTIEFLNNRQLPRDYIHALLFNVEAEAPVWRLRELNIENVDYADLGKGKVPPAEVKDEWEVRRLTFARRTPQL